jgi:hypothetical protein
LKGFEGFLSSSKSTARSLILLFSWFWKNIDFGFYLQLHTL